jgi:glutaredoxin
MPRRYRLPALLAMALMLPALAAAQANVYRWVDKDGKVHYSDTPPPEPQKNLTQKRVGGAFAESSELSYATQVAMQKSPVVLYAGADCKDPCARGRELLAKRGVPYTEKDVQNNADDAEALKKLVGELEVPFLTVGTGRARGFDEAAWHAALDAGGYPRTVTAAQREAAVPRKTGTPAAAAPAAPK